MKAGPPTAARPSARHWSPAAAAPLRRRIGEQQRRTTLIVRAATEDDNANPPPPPSPPSPPSPPQPQPSLTDPAQTVVWGGTLPSRRRFLLGTTAGAAVALGGNLFGVTSALFSSSPSAADAARRARLDVIFPIEGQLRCVDERERFEFAYPRQWMGDATLARRRAERQERERQDLLERASGLPPLRRPASSSSSSSAAPPAVEPVAAFGPPGSTGEENVSVVVAPIMPGFALEQLGSPAEAATTFLERTVAPPGSGRTAELFAASAGKRPFGRGDPSVLYYTFEFGVRSPTFERRNVSVLAARGDRLYTLNAQAPAGRWEQDGERLRRTAESFVLF